MLGSQSVIQIPLSDSSASVSDYSVTRQLVVSGCWKIRTIVAIRQHISTFVQYGSRQRLCVMYIPDQWYHQPVGDER